MEDKKTAPQPQRKNVTIRMPEHTWHKLTALARAQGLTMNALLIGMINEKTKR